jgi:uncharacterized heparinase superfamily protein
MTATRAHRPGRLRRGLARLAYRNPLYTALVIGGRTPPALAVVPPDPWTGEPRTGASLLNGVYAAAGQAIPFIRQTGGLISPDWRPAAASHGWLKALHGFSWLRDLRAVGGDMARRRARALVLSWLDAHAAWDDLAWSPEIAGARIANWIALHDFFCASADDDFRRQVFDSLARQARHLSRVVPGRLDGHDLLTALFGMAHGGISLPGQSRLLAEAMRQLDRELSRQVLADGGHVERNPSVQLAVLRQLIDLRGALRAGRYAVPEFVQHTIDRMTPALRFFRHCDGGLALFNGGREEDPAVVDAVLGQADARGRPLKSALHVGFERLIAGRTLLLMDVGRPPAPGIDAEAHAGTLSIEVSVGKERLIVNCGAHPAESDAWHAAMAATAAHSTVTIAETNSSEVLEGGGIGRRPTHVGCEREETEGAALVVGSHNGYAPGYGFLHRRRVYLADNGDDLRGEDVIEPVLGLEPVPQTFVVRFHLHPDVRIEMTGNGDQALLHLPSGQSWRLRAAGGTIEVAGSVYCGWGDEPRRTRQVTVTATASRQGAVIKWGLRRERPSA